LRLNAKYEVALLSELHTNNLARYDKLDAPILLASGSRVIACNWAAAAKALTRDTVWRKPLSDQVIANGVGALLRESLIDGIGSGAVGIAVDREIESRMC